MTSVIITGGSGFIGNSIVKKLQKNYDVTVFDIKQRNSNVNFIQGDIKDPKSVEDTLKSFDIVIHLAATLGVINTEKNPVLTLDTNLGGTKNVLEACKLHHIKKIIFSSSSEVYGEPLKIPIDESDSPIPITTYGVSKFAAEEYIKAYSRNYGIRYTIFRLFNVYGDEQATDWVLPEFVNRALSDQDILIHGDGSQIRSFCNVSDIANAFSKVIDDGDGEIINIGNDDEPISITDLAKKIILITNSKSKIKFIPFEESQRNRNEILKRVPKIEKAKKLLGYVPEISLENGIKKVMDFQLSKK
jgi:UDP-glucose 4-epimerase